MSVYVYGVVNQDVYNVLPFGTSNISATSKITPTMITRFIEEGSSFFTGALLNAGVSNESLSDAQNAQVSQGILNYCVGKSLQVLGGTGNSHMSLFDNAISQIRNNEAVLGVTGSTVESNINIITPVVRKFNQTSGW